jgi:uncharacterized protein YqgV (UPF0045/DUF77 family)
VSDLVNAVINNLQENASKYKLTPIAPQFSSDMAEKLAQASAEAQAKIQADAESIPEGNQASSE